MQNISLTVNKAAVYDEVAKTTSYAGAKMQDDEGAYERIFTTDDDRMMLERFWVEACNGATERLKQFITGVTDGAEGYDVRLEMSGSFDVNLRDSMETSLHSYFVGYIVAKWFKFTNKGESESYAGDAAGAMDDVMRKVYYRKKPTRAAI